jgi:hypothetical protein
MSELATNWTNAGLLEYLPKEYVEKCAKSLDAAYTAWLGEASQSYHRGTRNTFMPLVRQLYDTDLKDDIPDIDWLFHDYDLHWKNTTRNPIDYMHLIALECGVLSDYIETLIQRKQNNYEQRN